MKIFNKKASFDYELLEHFEVGMVLVGAEVKAARNGQVDLTGSFCRIIGNELFLVNAKIFPYQFARPDTYDERRTRKLLLHKKQIISLRSKIEGSNLTIVPVSVYTKGQLIKAELALAKPKKKFDKKETVKKRDIEREIAGALKKRY